jgi:hypothetical protein
MINNILFLAYEIWFYLLPITSINILLLLLYISWVFPYTTKKIKICGGPRDSVKIGSSSWSAKVCPVLLYSYVQKRMTGLYFMVLHSSALWCCEETVDDKHSEGEIALDLGTTLWGGGKIKRIIYVCGNQVDASVASPPVTSWYKVG